MRAIICPHFCRYNKPGKVEDPGCGGVEWLLKRPDLKEAVAGLTPGGTDHLFGLADDDPRLQTICDTCEFLVDGCDFRDPAVDRADCSPCGGLRAVAGLLAVGRDLGL